MPVTFGTVQLVPAPARREADAQQNAPQGAHQQQQADARDLAPALRFLHQRQARVRAH